MSRVRRWAWATIAAALALPAAAPAEVRLPSLVGSHMVLQRDVPARVWGWAAPGEAVRVSVGGASGGATAAGDGRWSVDLPPQPAGGPLTTVTRLATRREGGVWLVNKGVIYSCDGEALALLRSPCPLAGSINISTIFEDSRGRLWAGSDAGLAVLEADGGWRLLNDRFLNGC